MPTRELPLGYEIIQEKDLRTHMPRKEVVHEREVVNVVPGKCAYTVEFTRDEYGRIKSPITIKPI